MKRERKPTQSGVRRKDKETLRRGPMWRPLHVMRQLGNDYLAGLLGYNTAPKPHPSSPEVQVINVDLFPWRGALFECSQPVPQGGRRWRACLSIGDMNPI
jgi:hypothetical protein